MQQNLQKVSTTLTAYHFINHKIMKTTKRNFLGKSDELFLKHSIYCDDHTSLSSTTAVQIWIISYIFQIKIDITNLTLKGNLHSDKKFTSNHTKYF